MKIKKSVAKENNLDPIWKRDKVWVDLGSGQNKRPGCIGVDFRKGDGVDIVQDLSLFPWKEIPDEIVDVAYSSHLLEHINPAPANPQLAALIDLLKSKKILTEKEVADTVGDYKFLGGFIRFMDETWRLLKPGGQFISVFPYAGSSGFWQDPTHLNPITPVTLSYLDPLAKIEGTDQFYNLYTIYRPKPWKIVKCFYNQHGFIEVALEKRLIDPSYHCSEDDGMTMK
jgi:SAM-dependent methyltransferase